MATRAIARRRRSYFVRGRRRSKAKTRIPLAVVAGFFPIATFAYEGFKVGGLPNAGARVAQRLTGYDSSAHVFIWQELMKGWGPIVTGFVVHKLAQKFGLNRAIARSGIPFVSI